MTKKQMLAKMQDEYNISMDTYKFFKDTMNDQKTATKYWIEANQTEYLIRLLFDDNYSAYDAYLAWLNEQ